MVEFFKLFFGFLLGFSLVWAAVWMYFVYPWSQISLKSLYIGISIGIVAGIVTVVIIGVHWYMNSL